MSAQTTSSWDGRSPNSRARHVENLRSWIKIEESDSSPTHHLTETASCSKQRSKKSRGNFIPALQVMETRISFVASEETWTLWQNLKKAHSLDDLQLATFLVKQYGDTAQRSVCTSCRSPLSRFCAKCFILVPNPGCEEVPSTPTFACGSDAEVSDREENFDIELEEITQPTPAETVDEVKTQTEDAVVTKVEPELLEPDESWEELIAPGREIVACSFCNVSFPSIKCLNKHLEEHVNPQWQIEHKPEPRRTTRRKKPIPNYYDGGEDNMLECLDVMLNSFATSNMTEQPIKCIFCGHEYKKAIALTKHLQKHLKKDAFKCCICATLFDCVGELELHLKSHPRSLFLSDGDTLGDSKAHQCRICGIRFRYLGYLANHAEKHSEPNPFWCAACQRGFQYLADYTGHHCQTPGEKPELKVEQTQALQDFSSVAITLEPVHADSSLAEPDSPSESSTRGHSQKLNTQLSLEGDAQSVTGVKDLTDDQQPPPDFKDEEHKLLRTRTKATFIKKKRPNRRGTFKCPDCPSTFKFEGHLKIHTQKHTGKNAFACSHCEMTFPSKRQLLTHEEKVHWGSAPITCQECGRVMKSMYLLDEHMRLHTGELPFHCQICGEKLRTHAALSIHRRTHRTDLLTCKECGATFTEYSIYKTHMEEHSGVKPHLCSICGDAFPLRRHLKKHMLKHGQKQFICEHCGRAFYTAGEHKLHVMRHLGIKPFTCEICNKGFVQKQKLERHHISVHLQTKPYKCNLCPLAYSDSSRLKEHFRAIHTSERPYKCPVCGKAFAKSGCRQAHLRIHKREGKYP